MTLKLTAKTGVVIEVPDAFTPFAQAEHPVDSRARRCIETINGRVDFVFDPTNERYLERLDELRRMSKILNNRLAESLRLLPVAVNSKLNRSTNLFKFSVVVRPISCSNPHSPESNNQFDISGDSVVFCLHYDEQGAFQDARIIWDQKSLGVAKRKFLDKVFTDAYIDLLAVELDLDYIVKSVSTAFQSHFPNEVGSILRSLAEVDKYAFDPDVMGDEIFYLGLYVKWLCRGSKKPPREFVDKHMGEIMDKFPYLDQVLVRNLFFRRQR
jgi:hypothetical protein